MKLSKISRGKVLDNVGHKKNLVPKVLSPRLIFNGFARKSGRNCSLDNFWIDLDASGINATGAQPLQIAAIAAPDIEQSPAAANGTLNKGDDPPLFLVSRIITQIGALGN